MADQEWTVKELTEELKRFPADAKVYYDMGPNGPETIGKAQYAKTWGAPQRWELCWADRPGAELGNQYLLGSESRLMEAPMLSIPVIVLTTVVLWMAAIFAVLEEAKREPRRLFGCC